MVSTTADARICVSFLRKAQTTPVLAPPASCYSRTERRVNRVTLDLKAPNLKYCNFGFRVGPEHILLLARRPDIRVISLDTPDFTDVVLPFNGVSSSVAIDYDPVDDMVYWSSTVEHEEAILRAKLDGSSKSFAGSRYLFHDTCRGLRSGRKNCFSRYRAM